MPVSGIKEINKNVGNWVANVDGLQTEQVLTSIAMTAALAAKLDTPVDTAALINSQYYNVKGKQAVVGYSAGFSSTANAKSATWLTGAKFSLASSPAPKFVAHPKVSGGTFNYALYLHENEGWKGVKKTDAKHHFLSNAFESAESKADLMNIIKNGYRL